MKRMIVMAVVAACLGASPALARKAAVTNELGLSDQDCQALVTYQPPADVEYKPGVDVHGKPVVEADLAPPGIALPEPYSFNLTADAARRLGMAVPQGMEGQMTLGAITVDKAGAVRFNGNPVEGDAVAALKAFCAAKKTPESPKKPLQ